MKKTIAMVAIFIWLALTLPNHASANAQASLRLIAQESIEANFPSTHSCTLSGQFLFCVSFQGKLYVLNKNNLDVVYEVKVSDQNLTSIKASDNVILISSSDGHIYSYSNSRPFDFIDKKKWSDHGLSSIAFAKDFIITAESQANVAATSDLIILNQGIEGARAILGKKDLGKTGSIGEKFQANTSIYNANSNKLIAVISNVKDLNGQNTFNSLFVANDYLIQTTPGCCGNSIYIYDLRKIPRNRSGRNKNQIKPTMILDRPHINTAFINEERFLMVGTESGAVEIYDAMRQEKPTLVSSIDLRKETGFNGANEIEIRSLIQDSESGTIYATSSGGTEGEQAAGLPTVFALKYR